MGGIPPTPSTDPQRERPAAEPRSILFFPGTRPDRYPKALESGADLVCLDLEDAVAPSDKPAARAQAATLVAGHEWRPGRSAVRVNEPGTAAAAADLEALLEAPSSRDGSAAAFTLLVPKVDGAASVAWVRDTCARAGAAVRVVAMIETARGLAAVEEIAATEGVCALMLGAVDLSAELGCALDWESLLYARSRVVHAAALGGVQPVDVPFLGVRDPDGLAAEARAAQRLGFRSKAAIHPDQIPIIHEALRPSEDEVDRARRVVEAYHRSAGGVVLVDGRMVDRPVITAARRVLARAGESDVPPP